MFTEYSEKKPHIKYLRKCLFVYLFNIQFINHCFYVTYIRILFLNHNRHEENLYIHDKKRCLHANVCI